ncbi:MAG: sporulation protein YqfD [Firmicutes bacterium]|nr:sporulation protein YqfD [Bacillota bacterium]
MLKRLRPSVRFKLVDFDIKIINRLKTFGLKDLVVQEQTIWFTVNYEHRAAVVQMLGRRTFTSTDNRSIVTLVNYLHVRRALVLSVVVCLVAFMVLNQFIFRVRVDGLEGEEYAQVSTFLNTRGITGLVRKSVARDPNLAIDLTGEFPFIASTSINVRGSHLHISVQRADTAFPGISTGDIISDVDGVIGHIVVFSGIANVTIGDVVRKGDILVTGERATAIIKIVDGTNVVKTINNTVVFNN